MGDNERAVLRLPYWFRILILYCKKQAMTSLKNPTQEFGDQVLTRPGVLNQNRVRTTGVKS